MSKNVLDVLTERGFLEQLTHPEEIRELLDKEKVTFYIGFDPTADSLHIGHYIQIMVMSIMQQHGHRPIALLGGGTTMVGDPSDRTGMRQMMTFETINHNAMQFKKVFEKFLDFSEGKAIMVNNADWLMELNYIEFLREVGIHFSVNRMLSAEAYKNRMERGLTFLEFNYMLMQAYDFLVLYRRFGCRLQLWDLGKWQFTGVGKAGAFGNTSYQRTTANIGVDAFGPLGADDTDVSFFGEVGVNSTLWLCDWLAWRAGYNFFWLQGVATAPQQFSLVNFGSDSASINTNGAVFLQGFSTGLEARW